MPTSSALPSPRWAPWRLVLLLPAVLLAAGCRDEAPQAPPRPVLVATPGDATAGTVAFAGEVRAREETVLAFRVGGKLVSRRVDVGDAVGRGALLAELDPGDLRLQAGTVSAQLAAARAELGRASAERARFASLAGDQLVSRSARDAREAEHAVALGQARAARANLAAARNQEAYAKLRAPADGVIALRHAEAGQVVAAGQPVFTLAADGPREVAIALPESRIDRFSVGQPARVELWNARDKSLQGRIREIAPAADPATRTYAARVALLGRADAGLGQSARVFFAAGESDAATLSVPLAALQRSDDGGTAVWVVEPRTHALHLQPVQAGAYGEDRVPILRGLSAGDWIVAAGGHLLREGQVVRPLDRDNRPLTVAEQP